MKKQEMHSKSMLKKAYNEKAILEEKVESLKEKVAGLLKLLEWKETEIDKLKEDIKQVHYLNVMEIDLEQLPSQQEISSRKK